jgi:hypothetical protein
MVEIGSAAPHVDAQDAIRWLRHLRHGVANDLSVAVGNVELLLIGYYGPLNDRQRAAVEGVAEGLARVQERLRAVGAQLPQGNGSV